MQATSSAEHLLLGSASSETFITCAEHRDPTRKNFGAAAIKSMTFHNSQVVMLGDHVHTIWLVRALDRCAGPRLLMAAILGHLHCRVQLCAILLCATLMPGIWRVPNLVTFSITVEDRAWILVRQPRTSWPQVVENAEKRGDERET